MAGMKDRAKEYLAELEDKVNMYDFFYEGNGFKRRGLNTAIQIGEYIDKLEKENAKLNERICKVAQNIFDNWCKGDDPCPHLKKRDEQLTKAKELLKDWLQTSKASGCDNINIVTDTEQFLNSEVEK